MVVWLEMHRHAYLELVPHVCETFVKSGRKQILVMRHCDIMKVRFCDMSSSRWTSGSALPSKLLYLLCLYFPTCTPLMRGSLNMCHDLATTLPVPLVEVCWLDAKTERRLLIGGPQEWWHHGRSIWRPKERFVQGIKDRVLNAMARRFAQCKSTPQLNWNNIIAREGLIMM